MLSPFTVGVYHINSDKDRSGTGMLWALWNVLALLLVTHNNDHLQLAQVVELVTEYNGGD
jgi:hypothetical protein